MNDQNDRRLFTAVALSLVIITVWQFFLAPPPAAPPEVAPVEVAVGAGSPASRALPAVGKSPSAPAAAVVAEARCTGATSLIRSERTVFELSDCGAVRAIRFRDVDSPRTVTGWWAWAWGRVSGGMSGPWRPYVGGEAELDLLPAGEFLVAGRGAAALGGTWKMVSTNPVVQTRRTADGLTITRTLRRGEGAAWSATIRFETDRPLPGPFWVGVAQAPVPNPDPYKSVPLIMAGVDGSLETMLDSGFSAPVLVEGPVSWFGVGDRYHLAAAAPVSPEGGKLEWTQFSADRVGAIYTLGTDKLAPGAPVEAQFLVYTGQRELGALEAAGHGLEVAGSLGFFGFFAKYLLITLYLLHDQLGNWGYSILALTLLVRLVTYPLTRSALQSGRKMQGLQPFIKELQVKYADDKEALGREQMALFAKHGVNPVGGCLPMLAQMPIFFALFSALQYEPGLYNAEFFYLKDLSAQDPLGLLPSLVMAGMFLQQRITPMVGMDATQAQVMKFMPIVFGLMMWAAPAGLSLYYALNTVLAIAQQWYNLRSFPPIVPAGAPNVAT